MAIIQSGLAPNLLAVDPISNAARVTIYDTNGNIINSGDSVGVNGDPDPVSSTQSGGSVTTAAPTYITGTMQPLSLTTAGALRTDGSAALQPVSAVSLPLPAGASTSALQGGGLPAALGIGGGLKIDGSGTALPISGTITANIGTSGSLALNSTLTDGTQLNKITDGTNTATIKAANTEPLKTDKALVVSISPNSETIIKFDQDSYISQFTGFGRLRTAEPTTLFDCKQLTDNSPLLFDDQQTSGSGTASSWSQDTAASLMSVSLNTAGTRVRQTFQRFNYQPLKTQFIAMTGIIGTAKAHIASRIGYFDTNNGLYFESGGLDTTLGVVIRTHTSGSAVNTKVAQSSWNIDKLDGTGLSGITLDLTKTQIFLIDFQWLGVGRIRFGFDIGGRIVYCHEVNNANINTQVFMSNPNLPIRYEISNDGSGVAASLLHICCAVVSEGGSQDTGFIFSADRGATVLTTLNDTAIYSLVSIRLQAAKQMATIAVISVSIVCVATSLYRWCILLNPTVTGTALSFSAITNSAIEYDGVATNATKLTNGTQIFSGYASAGSASAGNSLTIDIPTNLRMGSNIAGTSDIICLGIQRLTGATESFYGSVSWREEI